jgi:hypothetical protein
MISLIKNKSSLKRKPNTYRTKGFQIIFEFKFRLIILHGAMNHLKNLGINLVFNMKG